MALLALSLHHLLVNPYSSHSSSSSSSSSGSESGIGRKPSNKTKRTAYIYSPHALQQRRAGGHGTSLNLREDPGSLPFALILVAAVAGKDSSKCGRGTTLGIIIPRAELEIFTPTLSESTVK